MQVSGTPNSSFHSDGEVTPILAEELAAAFIGEDEVDQDKGPLSKKGKVKEKKGSKSKSVAFINRETDVKDLVKDLSEKMASTQYITEQEGLKNILKKDIEQFFVSQGKEGLGKDQVKLSAGSLLASQKKMGKQGELQDVMSDFEADILGKKAEIGEDLKQRVKQQQDARKAQMSSREMYQLPAKERESHVQNALKQYMSAFSENLVKADSKSKRELSNLRQRLLSLGVSSKKLDTVGSRIQSVMFADLKKRVREGFIRYALTYKPGKVDAEVLDKQRQFQSLALLGEESGLFGTGRHRLKDIKDEARSELRSFIHQQLDDEVMAAKLKGNSPQDIINAFNRYNHLAGIANFNSADYMKSFQKKLDDLGLSYFEAPEGSALQVLDSEVDPDGRGRGAKKQLELDAADQEDMEDEVRALLMQQHIRKATLETSTLVDSNDSAFI